MRKLMMLPALLLLLSIARGAAEPPCDMSKVVKGYWCAEDSRILDEKELVSDVTYYQCPECKDIRKEAGTCEYCDKKLEKKTSGKNVCPECFVKPAAAEICVKAYYECPECGRQSLTAGHCDDCDKDLAPQTSRAVIRYVCTGCEASSLVPGKCTNKDCEQFDKPLKKTCSMSGTFPHVGPAPK
jgi:hypothetical protein